MDDGRLDALGQTIVGALAGAASGHSVAFNQLTVDVDAARIVDVVSRIDQDINLPASPADLADDARVWRHAQVSR